MYKRQRNAAAPLYDGTKVEYYPFGQDFFPRFLEKLKAARHYIFMEYFIVQDGEMWGRTLAVLRRKVKEGAVSYTHLDVYKRQAQNRVVFCSH